MHSSMCMHALNTRIKKDCMYSSSIQLAFTLVLSLVMQESASPHARTEGVTTLLVWTMHH